MRVSVCIDMLFSHLDFYDRFAAVKQAGIDTVEFWKWSNKDVDRVCKELRGNALSVSIFNLDSKDAALSADLSRGILNAGRKEELLKALEESIPVYKRLHASGMIVLIGEKLDIPYEQQVQNIVDCLRYVQPLAEQNGITLLVEPLNNIDRKNYFLPRSAEVLEILNEVNSPNIKLLFDIYHEQMMCGSVIGAINENIERIGHFHVADAPGRHEPGTGDIPYPEVLKVINSTTYAGYIGLEYKATKADETTFGFLGLDKEETS